MIRRYHDGTKHAFDRFARSLGYLDWASQPNPFRTFDGAAQRPLPPNPAAPGILSPIGVILRHALGLTAWKAFRGSRWPLRANPSSGNLHPTEAYVVCGPVVGLGTTAAVYHYAPDRHVLERRCAFESDALPDEVMLVVLTSIHWREAWKYGERAFRYCQHDLGHAIASIGFAASLVGWRVELQADWPHDDVATLAGVNRGGDYVDAEREEPGAVLALTGPSVGPERPRDAACRTRLLAAVREGAWTGRANQLSEDHVQWTFIDEIAAATRDPGRRQRVVAFRGAPRSPAARPAPPAFAPSLLLQRRSALAFDAQSSLPVARFFAMLQRVMPEDETPWSAVWWTARIHLAIFVHRIEGLTPGLYLLMREPVSGERLRAALGRDFLLEHVTADLPLLRLANGDARALARRVSCDQDIAADGFCSLGMIADFEASLAEYGDAFYRNLFWESGVVGQTLYLEAESAGARGTGIGCFYDDPVHDVLGLKGHAFQSLYHFAIGKPVEDARLTTSPGYEWEEAPHANRPALQVRSRSIEMPNRASVARVDSE